MSLHLLSAGGGAQSFPDGFVVTLRQIDGGQILLHFPNPPGAGDDGGHMRIAQAPRDRQWRRGFAEFGRQRGEAARALQLAVTGGADHHPLQLLVAGVAQAGIVRNAVVVLAGQQAGAQRQPLVVPRPSSAYNGAYSSSTRWRRSRLYCGCSMVGPCR